MVCQRVGSFLPWLTTPQSLTPQGIRLLSREVNDMRKNPTEGIRIDNDTEEDLSRLAGWVAGPGESFCPGHPRTSLVPEPDFDGRWTREASA